MNGIPRRAFVQGAAATALAIGAAGYSKPDFSSFGVPVALAGSIPPPIPTPPTPPVPSPAPPRAPTSSTEPASKMPISVVQHAAAAPAVLPKTGEPSPTAAVGPVTIGALTMIGFGAAMRGYRDQRNGWLRACPLVVGGMTQTSLDGETSVYDPSTIRIHQLNQTASEIWALCDGKRTSAEIVKTIATAHGLPEADISEDLSALFGRLESDGLITFVSSRATES